MKITNPFFSNEEMTTVDATIEHPEYGLVPTTYYIDGSDDRPEEVEELLKMTISAYVPPAPPTAEQQAILDNYYAKEVREDAISALTVTSSSGLVYDADRPALLAVTTAVTLGEPGETSPWKLADNTVKVVPWEELKEVGREIGFLHTALIAV